MASSNNSRRSSVSNADSGISCSTTTATVNPRYACYWLNHCQGKHELDDCLARRHDLRGKLGIYFSPSGLFQRFSRDMINNLPLEGNPTGCTMINLLIYKKINDEIWLLFVTQLRREKRQDNSEEENRRLLLALPSSNPRVKNEVAKQVAVRALESITTNGQEIIQDVRTRLKRFLFVDASVIYPLYLNNDEADLLTTRFSPNEEVQSLHWFRLVAILDSLPPWDDYLLREAQGKELAQIRHPIHAGIRLNNDNQEYTFWSVTAAYLMCIRNHVGFETFLQL